MSCCKVTWCNKETEFVSNKNQKYRGPPVYVCAKAVESM